MIFEVEMHAYGNGEIRKVEIPDNEFVDSSGWKILNLSSFPTDQLLEKIYHWGQNEIQPVDMPSISSGDVVLLNGERYLCCVVGWKKLSQEEYDAHKTESALISRQIKDLTLTNEELSRLIIKRKLNTEADDKLD